MEGGVTPFSSSMAPSGSYILIVVSQPLTEEHKQIILQRLDKGLLSWDVTSTGCDLSGLEYAFSTNIKDSVTESDVLIQHSTESLGVEVLLSPTVRTLKQCVKNLLSTQTSHKQLVHAGYTFAGSGSWILENGTFSFAEFLEIFQQADVQSQKRCIINVHCAEEGDWSKTNFSKDIFTKTADVALNPPEKVNHVPGSEHLIKCLDNALTTQGLEDMMKPSPLVGNIRFNRPTIYMFPAGQGDCALFGINGFNMLIDGGFHRKPCSWDFIRHLDRLDAVLVTRIGESNVCGMSTLMKRNSLNNANPQIGYVFCNIADSKSSSSKNGTTETKDDLIVSVVGEGHNFVQTLNDLKLKPHQCWRDSSIDPFVLYHKVGQGTLEMHVLSPPRDSKEMKLFLSEWNAYKETFSGVKSELKGSDNMIPLSHATSICAILVWRPEDPKDTITRILFPGSAPQYKILEGLEKLKVLNILNHPVVTKASLNIPSSKVISNKVEKSVSRASIPNRNNTASPALSVSSIASRNGDIGNHKKDVREIKRVTKEIKKENKEIKKEIKKDVKKDVKKDAKVDAAPKKDSSVKKETVKDIKKETKEIKKVVKKENKDVKTAIDKKETKPIPKKDATPIAKATAEVKKATTAKKSTTPIKKDAGKPPIAPKTADAKKSVSKVSEQKTTKDVTNKKTIEAKTINKAKPKSTSSPKTPTTPKTKPVAVPKPGSKMTKAVAASSVVASAVAVTVAAVELNEKKEVIEDTEPEISEKEGETIPEPKEAVANEKPVDDLGSPMPPEALSPTPSESVSLTPSDTLSSAPLETVSPTPPLPNEPISAEEKDVNEIKDLEQDMPYEQVVEVEDNLKAENAVNDIEVELEKHQASNDVMNTSFIAEKHLEETTFEEQNFEKTEFKENESAPLKVDIDKDEASEKEDISEDKDTEEEKFKENNIAQDIVEEAEPLYDNSREKDVVEEKEIFEEKETEGEKDVIDEKKTMEEKDFSEENDVVEETDSVEEKDIAEEKVTDQPTDFEENDTAVDQKPVNSVEDAADDTIDVKFSAHETDTNEKEETFEEKEVDDIDIVEEKDDNKEKDLLEHLNATLENNMTEDAEEFSCIPDKNEVKSSYEDNIEIDKQLAGLTMEGSFCAGMMPSENEILAAEKLECIQNIETKDTSNEQSLSYSTEIVEEHYEKETVSKHESHFKTEVTELEVVLESETSEEHIQKELNEYMQKKDEITNETEAESFETQQMKQESIIHESHFKEPDQNKQVSSEKEDFSHPNVLQYDKITTEADLQESSIHTFASSDPPFDKFSNMKSMEASFHQDMYENYEPANIDDLDMQETSVDEPEEIIRKESDVSITLNDENLEPHYTDNWRRKSGTESEDDVDIGKYMSKEQTADEEKLCVRGGSDSDEEDVVKSPTPHAVVEYEGQSDDVISTIKQDITDNEREIHTRRGMYLNEKEDFDEKDRDSAEEQDTDDGEMIRHPTPPEMKYSDEEMRDPIGQHYITNPSLKPQVSDITDQPLYEEAEDSSSERSVSPIIEQPVFGNTIQADFPELVTVSGGTTPSEPQSPKATFDTKKIAADAAVMEALSEHDISDSSTHSPSCQDGSTAFDLQGSERSVIEVHSLQDDEVCKISDENQEKLTLNKDIPSDLHHISTTEEPSKIETPVFDEDKDKKEDKQETPSDEEESSSEDENSESHSKDKSDAMGDKSDVERDDRSDIHNDDRSDHHHDKSDVVNDDDDDKSDIHEDEQLYKQQDKCMEYESEDGFHKDLKADDQEICYVAKDAEKLDADENNYKNSPNVHGEYASNVEQEHSSYVLSESHYLENIETKETTHHSNDDFADDLNVKTVSNIPLSDENRICNQVYSSGEMCADTGSKNIFEYESQYASENYRSSFHHVSSSNEQIISKEEISSDYDLNIHNKPFTETEKEDEIEDSPYTFQAAEADFENSKPYSDVHGFNTFTCETENESTSIETHHKVVAENISDYSQDIPSGFGNSDDFEHLERKDDVELHEDISPQHAENVSIVENKILSEEKEARQYENLFPHDENMHISNVAYSEDDLIKNVLNTESQSEKHFLSTEESANEEKFNYVNSQSFANSSTYECSSATVSDKIAEIDNYQQNSSYIETGFGESYSNSSHLTYGMNDTLQNFTNLSDYKHLTENHSHPEEHYMQNMTQLKETYAEKEISESAENFITGNSELIEKNASEILDLNSNDTVKVSESTSELTVVNGKDQTLFSLPSSELSSQFFDSKSSHQEIIPNASQQLEQESTYLINNRFQSDSPEDNTMRSDSSPDVPYPLEIADKFADIKNSMSTEARSDSYVHDTEDYKNNMNFTNADTIPLSSQNNSLNANENNTYGESSEDESTSPVRGNVSPYAYTNKAYSREEEDVDGNHIYREETTEVIKQVEFDGNNIQTLSTNQVSSVMNYSQEYPDGQYSTGANYDFHLEEWGKPMGLPTPPDTTQKTVKKSEKMTVKSKTAVDANGKVHSPSVSSKLSSPLKKPKPKVAKESSSSPIYVDLAYVPQHADPHYCDVEFFKKIRARYYVISSVNPSKEVLNALLEAKKTWNEDLSVTIIPTYETDTLGYWMAQNQNDLAEYSIDVSPSASRCTVNLQDHQTSCSAYRLEF